MSDAGDRPILQAPPAPSGWLRVVRRGYSLPAELGILAGTVFAWQLLRLPFEVGTGRAIDAARDLRSLERAIGMAIEGGLIQWTHERPWLLHTAEWFYSHMDETIVFGVFVALRLVDPSRFPTVRTAFVLAHVPALAVVAGYPMAPPRWLPDTPFAHPAPPGFEGGLRNSTAAAVSLHVGLPVLLAIAAIWIRPRSRLAWLTCLYPAAVLYVVVATGHHFVLDAVIGVACVLFGWAAARVFHGDVPRGRPETSVARIWLAGCLAAVAAFAVNAVLITLASM